MDFLPGALSAMENCAQFILWKAVPSTVVPGRTEKKPVNPHTGAVADAHDRNIWVTAEEACRSSKRHGLGVGFVFTADDPYFFLDIDDCRVGDGWSPIAMELMGRFPGAAVEISQSGNGLHIIGIGQAPAHRKKKSKAGFDLYTESRFVALTGDIIDGDVGKWDHSDGIHALVADYLMQDAIADTAWTDEPREDWRGPADDSELISMMLRTKLTAAGVFGGKATLVDLWDAESEALGCSYPDTQGANEYDASSADAALCQHLAFWTGCDCERIDRLFRESSLMREKWDARPDYRERTILRAVGLCTAVLKTREVALPPEVAQVSTGPVAVRRTGAQILCVDQQLELFAGCVYVCNEHRIFTPLRGALHPNQFKAIYGGYTYVLDTTNDKTTRNAWEAFTESQAVSFPKVDAVCFRPELPVGAIVKEEGRTILNTYTPLKVASCHGDVAPFLNHLELLIRDPRDRAVLLAWMCACIQHKGVKFQWSPVLQGVEGNGKTFLMDCVAYAIGERYTHRPNAVDLANKFNGWIQNKLFIAIEELHVAGKREVADALKPLITNRRIEIQAKGSDQFTGDNRANIMISSNHRDAVMKTPNDRRYCNFFTAQQKAEDLIRDKMTGDYFPRLYAWFRNGGAARVAHYLETTAIPDELNPATLCTRAPDTSSTEDALVASMGGVEQEILAAVDECRPGFCGGWVSSIAVDRLLEERRMGGRVSRIKRREMLEALGYVIHPGLAKGRSNQVTVTDGGKPRLYVKKGSLHCELTGAPNITGAYEKAQNSSSVFVDTSVNKG